MLSTSGGCQLLGGKLVSWSSKKKNSMAPSTTQTESIVAISFVHNLCGCNIDQLADYDMRFSKIPIICDNKSVIAII